MKWNVSLVFGINHSCVFVYCGCEEFIMHWCYCLSEVGSGLDLAKFTQCLMS